MRTLQIAHYPYPSRRMPVLASRGVVATSEPLAAQAGLRILQKGGNAVDAAIATAIALVVVEPTATGIGSDAFGLVWDGSKLHGLNGSGRSSASLTLEHVRRLGVSKIPTRGWLPVTVPGGPAAWRDMHARFGRLPFEVLFEPAIEYAEHGFPVAPVTADRWASAARIYAEAAIDAPELRAWGETFTFGGRAPAAGEVWSSRDLARTLRLLAESGANDFYSGTLAAQIADFAAATGGLLTRADLAAHESSWVEPVSTTYRGHEVWELPPNTQGIAALSALAILDQVDLAKYPRESVESYHLQIEAMKLAMADMQRYVADPGEPHARWRWMIDREYAKSRLGRIGHEALIPEPGQPFEKGTVYLAVADGDGMMVSFIQSNYSGWLLGFGSGVVVPQTGIALHSRGCAFSLDPAHPNVVAPNKRPFHTLAPAFLTCGGEAVGPFGVMGGPMQPQGHVQLMVNQLDYGMNPQTSLDAPRWQWTREREVEVELSVPSHVLSGLAARGHILNPRIEFEVAVPQPDVVGLVGRGDFGKGQIIRRLKSGVYVAGSEPRSDGCAVGY